MQTQSRLKCSTRHHHHHCPCPPRLSQSSPPPPCPPTVPPFSMYWLSMLTTCLQKSLHISVVVCLNPSSVRLLLPLLLLLLPLHQVRLQTQTSGQVQFKGTFNCFYQALKHEVSHTPPPPPLTSSLSHTPPPPPSPPPSLASRHNTWKLRLVTMASISCTGGMRYSLCS